MGKNLDLGIVVRQLADMIPGDGSCGVSYHFDVAKNTLTLTRRDCSGDAVEEFVVWCSPSMKPVAAYTLHDKTSLRRFEEQQQNNSNGDSPMVANCVRPFVLGIFDRKGDLSRLGVLSHQETVSREEVPSLTKYFANHMLHA